MRYLHTMVRIRNLETSIAFYCNCLGMKKISEHVSEAGQFTLIMLAAPKDAKRACHEKTPLLELTYNWDDEEYISGRNFGHLAYAVDNIYETCKTLMDKGIIINRPPRDGKMAFVRSPDNISIEILQEGKALTLQEPWMSMPNVGQW